jgi:hypothetical protein
MPTKRRDESLVLIRKEDHERLKAVAKFEHRTLKAQFGLILDQWLVEKGVEYEKEVQASKASKEADKSGTSLSS